jgi:hypothetical protein
MSALAPVLASTVIGSDIIQAIKAIDRLFGQTWIIDVEPFRNAFDKWAVFKDEYRRFVFSGKTTDERLFANGTLDAFDHARESRNVAQMTQLLRDVYLDEGSIKRIVTEN